MSFRHAARPAVAPYRGIMKSLIKFLATGFGSGLVPVAPGLVGSLVGLGYWWLLIRSAHVWVYWLAFVAGVALAVWIAGAASELLRDPDPPSVVIDEIVVVPLALAGLHPVWWHIALGFVLFRFFDVLKPPPVRQAENFSGGVGIVLDDVIAALYACAGTHAIIWAVGAIRR
jgi:phosphatidylglycerophosphatase A